MSQRPRTPRQAQFAEVNKHLRSFLNSGAENVGAVYRILQQFVEANEDPKTSPNFRTPGADDLQFLIKVAKVKNITEDEDISLLLLKCFKILSRKQENRASIGEGGIRTITQFLQAPLSTRIAGEGANVILNICYEKDNVEHVLKCNGVLPLVSFLKAGDLDLQANAAGAIQSICFQEKGRLHVRDCGSIPSIIDLLPCENTKVQTRAVGAIHNMSSDPDSIRIIRRKDGIPHLIELLSSEHTAISGSAAGALQNVSREVASRRIIRESGAVPPLSALLFGADLQAQVCAAGALLNILGPELGGDRNVGNRKGFGRIISLCLVMGMVHEALFDEVAEVDPDMIAAADVEL